jgi:hypothetical protein
MSEPHKYAKRKQKINGTYIFPKGLDTHMVD